MTVERVENSMSETANQDQVAPCACCQGQAQETSTSSSRTRLILGVVVLAGLLVASKLLPVTSWLRSFLVWSNHLGPAAPLAFIGVYILACVLLLPGSVLSLGAAVAFGFWKGLIAVSIGSTLGACAAFWVGRTIGRSWVEEKVQADPKLRALDQAVGREGRKIVFLTRLSPVFPFNLLNFFYGVTRVPFLDYALASWIGMLPGTAVFVLVGSLGRGAAEAATGQASSLKLVMMGVGLAATIAVTAYVTKIARCALDEAIEEDAKETTLPSA
jgi:uncharacterized membrane protein YdjX (TVP38/TMEM64 family)